MQDRQLYQQILGIESPWFVARVELQLESRAVHVYLEHLDDAQWKCPDCERVCTLHDHQPERVWRHLDTCQYQTLMHAATPRTECPEHGVKAIRLPWAEPRSRFTLLFEALVIEWLKVASQKAVGDQFSLSWDEVHGIMERAVARGLRRRVAEPIRDLGVDEKSFRKGHRYATIVTDLERGRVLYVAEGRSRESLDGFWKTLTQDQLQGIRAVALDMWEPYIQSIQAHLPNAHEKIVFDKFHIMKHANEAVDKVRRRENRELLKDKDDRLKGTKYTWLRNTFLWTAEQWHEFRAQRTQDLRTARAWAIKESLTRFWLYWYPGSARKHFDQWYAWAIRSRLEPVKQLARMLKSRLDNLLTYIRYRITNATSESLNAKIQWAKYTARGFRNWDNFVNAIYFHCGKLDLAPSTSAT